METEPTAFLAAAVQLNSTPDLDENLKQAEHWIAEAVEHGAALVGLPENFSFLGPEPEKVTRAQEIAEKSEAFLAAQAALHGITLLGGGYAVPAPSGKTFNRSLLVGPDGEIARYDKIHLFDVDLPEQTFRESDTVESGTEVVVADADPLGSLGLSICYDLRFPELYRRLAQQGAHTLTVPSAFTGFTGHAHWEVLLRARAIENTCYVFAPAQCGRHFADRVSHGHALIVDPWGSMLSDAGTEPGYALAEIDPARVAEVRARIPSLNHRAL